MEHLLPMLGHDSHDSTGFHPALLPLLALLQRRNRGGGGGGGGGLFRRRRGGGGGGGGGLFRRRRGGRGGNFTLGDLADEIDEMDDYELYDTGYDAEFEQFDETIGAMEDAEIDRLTADDDDDEDESTLEGIGANIYKLQQKTEDIKAKLQAKQHELNNTPQWRKRRRRRLQRQIARLQKSLMKKQGKLQGKTAKAEGKYQRKYGERPPPGTFNRPGIVPVGTGTHNGPVFRPGAPPVLGNYPWFNQERPPGSGLRIPFRDQNTGQLVSRVTVAPGAGLRTATVNMATVGVAFGEFRVRAIDLNFKATKPVVLGASADGELLTNLIIEQAQVDGSIDLLLQSADYVQTAMTAGNQATAQRTLTGIREDTILDKTNIATIQFTFRQEIDTTATNVEASITAALVVDRIMDRNAERPG